MNSLTTSIYNFFKRSFIYADARIVQNKDLFSEPVVESNLQWHKGVNMLEFLQKIGVHARVNAMLNRERSALSSFRRTSASTLIFPHPASARD